MIDTAATLIRYLPLRAQLRTQTLNGDEEEEHERNEPVFDAHVKAELVNKDVAATMATVAPEPHLTHVPTLTGGTGRAEWSAF